MTWDDLQQALNTSGEVALLNDVTASASDGPLVIPSGVPVQLDLNGHKLNRGMDEAAENGSVITVQGTLTLADSAGGGKLTGGYALNGGGIYNSGTLTIEGASIEGNRAEQNGGGTVSGNTSSRNGSGIYNAGTISMEGTPVVQNNTGSNLYLPDGKRIEITVIMNSGAKICISSPAFVTTFTEHYSDFALPDPSVYFFSDAKGCRITRNGYLKNHPDSYEGRWETILTYLDVDSYRRQVCTLETNYTLLTPDSRDLTHTWYVARGDVTVSGRLNVQNQSAVNILLLDGAVLRATEGIYVSSDSTLDIYAQSGETGQLIATGKAHGAGIGSKDEGGYGSIYIHGGQIQASGSDFSAGIGGARNAANDSGLVVIYGGDVTAQGGPYGAGIGGGGNGMEPPLFGNPGTLIFYGGTVNATGGGAGAGIGNGNNAKNGGSIEIHGGIINAYGGTAGIGGGFDAENYDLSVLITGGQVYAKGRGNAAGIGGGGGAAVDAGSGCKVNITGGSVTAVSEHYAIGKAYIDYSNQHGTLNMYDLARVKTGSSESGAVFVASGSRVNVCRDSKYVRIEPCTHDGAAYAASQSGHIANCPNCLQAGGEEPHQYTGGVCDVCGYESVKWILHFDPNGGSGTMPIIEVAHGDSLNLPECDFTAPEGMAFLHWRINGFDYPAGTLYRPIDHHTLQAVWTESSWSLLQEQINSADENETIFLSADLVAAESDAHLNIPSGKHITLDLNDHTLSGRYVLGRILNIESGAGLTLTDTVGDGAITHGKWYGVYVNPDSSFTMDGGEIRLCGQGIQVNGTAVMNGGGIMNCTDNGGVIVDGNFTMTAGSIRENVCASTTDGGGVTVNGTFRMSGGSIIFNQGQSGGGMFVQTASGHFIMEGGSITGNSAPYGGGVYISSNWGDDSITLSGSASITGNSSKNGAVANLVLAENANNIFHNITMAGPVAGRVGVTIHPYGETGTELSGIAFTTGLNGRSIGGFFSDNPTYGIRLNADGEACFTDPNALAEPDFHLPSGVLDIQSEVFVGIGATVIYIPDSCNSIGTGAFRDCPNLTQVLIPANCTVDADAFAGGFGLKIFGYTDSPAESYCRENTYCIFIPLD